MEWKTRGYIWKLERYITRGVVSSTFFDMCVDDLGGHLIQSKGVTIGNVTMNHLFFADDLLLFSESQARPQTSLMAYRFLRAVVHGRKYKENKDYGVQ